jgi:phosphopantothenoylcysteine synthetase/decarboxylase
LANDVSEGTFGADENHVWLVTKTETQDWKPQSKQAVAERLVKEIILSSRA